MKSWRVIYPNRSIIFVDHMRNLWKQQTMCFNLLIPIIQRASSKSAITLSSFRSQIFQFWQEDEILHHFSKSESNIQPHVRDKAERCVLWIRSRTLFYSYSLTGIQKKENRKQKWVEHTPCKEVVDNTRANARSDCGMPLPLPLAALTSLAQTMNLIKKRRNNNNDDNDDSGYISNESELDKR